MPESRDRTVLVVRHALAVPRKAWDGSDDRERPLTEEGRARAEDLVALLDGYGLERLTCSPSARCADTVRPFLRQATDSSVATTWAPTLSEEGYRAHPRRLRGVVTAGLKGRGPVAFCSHGPVLRPLLREITDRYRVRDDDVRRVLRKVRRTNLDKGEVLALVVRTPRKKPPTIVGVTRHRP